MQMMMAQARMWLRWTCGCLPKPNLVMGGQHLMRGWVTSWYRRSTVHHCGTSFCDTDLTCHVYIGLHLCLVHVPRCYSPLDPLDRNMYSLPVCLSPLVYLKTYSVVL
eukprot:jgi/Mesen1/242/ME1142709C07527